MPSICYSAPKWLLRFDRALKEDGDVKLADFIPARSFDKVQMIFDARKILQEYHEQGYQLTLRQLYYQFVSRDMIANSQKEYKRLGDAVAEGRMWGILDWDHIVDRGRNLSYRSSWDNAGDIIDAAARSFHLDWWQDGDVRPEVWVEKQALEEVVGRAAEPYDVAHMACKGYMSLSEMWASAMRIKARYEETGQQTLIIHLGDHDPSGINMTDDMESRLYQFDLSARMFEVHRIALNMDQVEQYNPPPNPAKQTDSRFASYEAKYGDESWELDALEPRILNDLIVEAIKPCIRNSWHQRREEEDQIKHQLALVAERWDEVTEMIDE